jgi:hypothetical protein
MFLVLIIFTFWLFSDVYDIPDGCEEWLYNSYFTDISQSEMNGIVNFMGAERESLHDYDIVPKKIVHRLDNDDMIRLVSSYSFIIYLLYNFNLLNIFN